MREKKMNKLRIQSGVSYGDLWLGIIIGVMIGWGITYLYEEIEPLINPLTPEFICQKGKTYQATVYGGNVYTKVDTECIDTTFLEEVE